MNSELYNFICVAKINESIHMATFIILRDKDESYIQLQETFINVCSYIGSFLSVSETCLWIDTLTDVFNFINDTEIAIPKVYSLITKLCIICDINAKNPVIITGTLSVKTVRQKVIGIFENDQFTLSNAGITKIRDLLPPADCETYNLVSQIITGYIYNTREEIIDKLAMDLDEIRKHTNRLRDSIDYIIRKKFVFENKLYPNDCDCIWFLWSIMIILFENPDMRLLFNLFKFEYNKKNRGKRLGLLHGSFLIAIYNMKKDISRKWNKNELIMISKIEEVAMSMYADIKQDILSQNKSFVENKACDSTISSRNGLEYLSNFRPILCENKEPEYHDKVDEIKKVVRYKHRSLS